MIRSMQKRMAEFLVGFSACAFVASGAPLISIDSATYDLGVIYEGKRDSAMHSFKVKNTGDSVLLVKSVKPG